MVAMHSMPEVHLPVVVQHMLICCVWLLPARRRAQSALLSQSSVVHLQGVPLSRRFALVPLGPPLLSYSPTAKVGRAASAFNGQ